MPFCKMAGLWDEYFFEVYRGGLLGPNLKISFRLFLHLPFSVFS